LKQQQHYYVNDMLLPRMR